MDSRLPRFRALLLKASAEEIDISNEWEEMIEVEPGRDVSSGSLKLEVQSYQEILAGAGTCAEVPLEPEASIERRTA